MAELFLTKSIQYHSAAISYSDTDYHDLYGGGRKGGSESVHVKYISQTIMIIVCFSVNKVDTTVTKVMVVKVLWRGLKQLRMRQPNL